MLGGGVVCAWAKLDVVSENREVWCIETYIGQALLVVKVYSLEHL